MSDLVNTNRGAARFIGKTEDDYKVFDMIQYEDFYADGKCWSVAEHTAFTGYTEFGELICAITGENIEEE